MDINGVKIDFLGHSGFVLECRNGQRVAIDPFNISGNVEKVDVVLITHSHYDHCSIKDIQNIIREGGTIVGPADSQSKIRKIEKVGMEVIEIGEELRFGNFKVEAIPAYNVDKDFHSKSEGWMGFVVKTGSVIIYHAGDTDKIPEMQRLTGYGKKGNEFIVLLPVSGKFVMDADEASEVASLLNPSLAIPMHYGAGVAGTIEDAERFVELCKEKSLKAEVMRKI
jgi:L-ascorbate metabolism protein UlaG (beta-lactamase superfamily)